MITYTWKVTSLKIKDIDLARPNAVVQTYWQKIGTDETGNTGTFAGATPFTVDPEDSSGPFKPFSELTEADIIAWIQTVVTGGYEEHVNAKIAEQIAQNIEPVTEAALPWVPAEPTTEPTPAP